MTRFPHLCHGPWVALLAFVAAVAAPAAEAPRFGDATPLEWSRRMADSEMSRRGNSMFFEGAPRARWDYTTSLLGLSLLKLAEETGNPAYTDYGAKTVETFVAPDGTIRTYKREEYNIDMIPPGKVMLLRYEQGHRPAHLRQAIEALRDQMREHPRTSEGGYWHKLRYPYQMWLDGLFMASPFLAHYAQVFEEPALFDDVANQLLLMDRYGYDAKTGLHYHAWDEKRQQPWANPETGQSPNFWSRAIGWYAMGLVDSLDFFSPTHPEVEEINEVLRRVADGIVRWQDPATGLWWQVTDQGERAGNYREATASSMFVYALAKGINRGYLPRDTYLPTVLKGYEGIIRDLIRKDPGGLISLTQCCEVAGLGYTNSAGRVRDGSFDYYISEPVIDNDLKGTGPFILAGIEVQRLLTTAASAAPVRVTGWSALPALLARIQAPVFPERDFPITDFGAREGGQQLATEAIRRAIQACHDAGGGRVVVPPGVWLTGAVHLKSNVNLHVSEGATLRFSPNPEHYPVVFTRWEGMEMMGLSPLVYAFEQENIAITGKGTLDGQGSPTQWWPWKGRPQDGWREGMDRQNASRAELFRLAEQGVPPEQRRFGLGSGLRPQFIQPYRSRNVLIEGVTVRNSPMWHLNPVLCENVIVRGVTVIGHGPNNDGCNPESCRDVLIEDCLFDTGDDCIAIKSGRNADGRRIGVPSENIIIRNCTMKDGHGGVVLGSEMLRRHPQCVRGGLHDGQPEPGPGAAVQEQRLARRRAGKHLHAPGEDRPGLGGGADDRSAVRRRRQRGVHAGGAQRADGPDQQLGQSAGDVHRGFEGATVDQIRISNSTFQGVTHTEVVQRRTH
jgi:unsaturated rhamnogalacturonyl hydrolase